MPPFSTSVYVLVAVVLTVNIRCNPCIPGLSLPGVPLVISPISQCANDTTFILSSDDSIKSVFDTYSLFENWDWDELSK